MKAFNRIITFILTITILGSACSTSKKNSMAHAKNYSPVSKGIYDSIAYLDSVFFNAFNTRSLEKLEPILSENLEFYHDLGGVTNYNKTEFNFYL